MAASSAGSRARLGLASFRSHVLIWPRLLAKTVLERQPAGAVRSERICGRCSHQAAEASVDLPLRLVGLLFGNVSNDVHNSGDVGVAGVASCQKPCPNPNAEKGAAQFG